jgi:hypothetical protein
MMFGLLPFIFDCENACTTLSDEHIKKINKCLAIDLVIKVPAILSEKNQSIIQSNVLNVMKD